MKIADFKQRVNSVGWDLTVCRKFKQRVGVGGALTKDVHRVPGESKKSPDKAQAVAVSRALPAVLPGAVTGG